MTGRRVTRVDETRDAEIRAVLDQIQSSPLDLPAHEVPDGQEYAWCRKTVNGFEDEGNLTEKSRLGWKAVPAARHPSLGSNASIFDRSEDRQSHSKGYIEYRGLVLCERPKVVGDAIRRHRQMENIEIMQSLPGMDGVANGYVGANKQSGGLSRDAAFLE